MSKLGRPVGTKDKWNVGGKKSKTREERFWEKVLIPNTEDREQMCWEWQANIVYGYGMFTIGGGKQTGAHQWSWRYFNGDIPDGLCVLHKCDNRKCVNPNHLFLGTYKDNAVDRENKHRGVIPHIYGENHPSSKLTDDIVISIRKDSELGMNDTEISKKYGISRNTVGGIRRRITWRHVA